MAANKKGPRRINLDMILDATSLTRSSNESSDVYLQRVTHLHLQGKRIKKIAGLEICSNLKVLYLYDNLIETIENMEFATLLQYLYLQNNAIVEIPELPLPNLTKLLLDENHISYVTGLEKCTKLEELRIGNQAVPPHISLTFDPISLTSISRTLQGLDISGNGISTFSPFTVLRNLRKLFAGDNEVIDLSEVEDIIRLPRLEEAVFLGNPCCNIKRYRDYAIGASSNTLQILDNVPVLKHQQVAIRGLMDHRRQLGTAVVDLSLTAGQQLAISEYEKSIGSNSSTIFEEGNDEDN